MSHCSLNPWKKVMHVWGRSSREIYGSKCSSLFEIHWKPLVVCRASSVHFLMKIPRVSSLNEVPNPGTLLSANSYILLLKDRQQRQHCHCVLSGSTWEKGLEVARSALHLPTFSSKALHCHGKGWSGGRVELEIKIALLWRNVTLRKVQSVLETHLPQRDCPWGREKKIPWWMRAPYS